jgi:hypothetical protein
MYRENGMIFCVIPDERYGNPKLARIIPKDDSNWGEYKDLEKEKDWEKLVPVLSEEDIDRALRGDAKSLMQSGLRDPKGCLKLVPIKNSVCVEKKGCPSYTNKCDFRNKDCPECFIVDGDMNLIKRNLIEAWRRGYIVVRMLEF